MSTAVWQAMDAGFAVVIVMRAIAMLKVAGFNLPLDISLSRSGP